MHCSALGFRVTSHDVILGPWVLNTLTTQLFVQQIVLVRNSGNIIIRYFWSCVRITVGKNTWCFEVDHTIQRNGFVALHPQNRSVCSLSNQNQQLRLHMELTGNYMYIDGSLFYGYNKIHKEFIIKQMRFYPPVFHARKPLTCDVWGSMFCVNLHHKIYRDLSF